jgi:gamma-glutamyltranspeptidase
MSPTIASAAGRPVLVTGGACGSRIIMGTLLTTLNRLKFGLDIAHAVDAERLDAQASPPTASGIGRSRSSPRDRHYRER